MNNEVKHWGSHVYHRLIGPVVSVPVNLLPTSVKIVFDEYGRPICEIEGSEECIQNIIDVLGEDTIKELLEGIE